MKDFVEKLGRLLIVTILTHLVVLALIVLITYHPEYDPNNAKNFTTLEIIFLSWIFGAVFYVPASLLTALFLHVTKISKRVLDSKILQAVIYTLIVVVYLLLGIAIRKLPHDVVYFSTPEVSGVRIWFGETTKLIYSCVIIVLSFLVFRLFKPTQTQVQ